MLQIDKTLISLDIIEKTFVCDLGACKGTCCEEGDSGAPLDDEETTIIENIYPTVEKYMTSEGIAAVKKQGPWVVDSDGDKVTPLVNKQECAYSFKDKNGVILCAIEKAFRNKEIDYYKPISCHLYPIRITKYKQYDAVNYESNKLCIPARIKGEKLGIPIYRFVKEPLIRKYGEAWYEQLTIAVDEYEKYKKHAN